MDVPAPPAGSASRASMFSAPVWLRDLGFGSWLLVGFGLVLVGLIWLLGQTSTIVMPVILACVLGAVAGPLVDKAESRGLPRPASAVLVLLGFVAIGAFVTFLVVHGITANASDVSSKASQALDKIAGWLEDAGIKGGSDATQSIEKAVPQMQGTLVNGLAKGIDGLTSIVFFLAFSALATFFVLKDAPVMTRFVNGHMGIPVATAQVVTREVASSLRSYFAGVTIIAAFNGVVVGVGAYILGVPLAGTIAIVTFVTAYVPFIGAWVAGIFAVALALGSQGPTDALILVAIVLLANGLLQNMLQPFVFGATLSLNPLVVLVATIGGGCLFGMVGLTLAAPLVSAAVHISQELRPDGAGEASPAPGTSDPLPQ